jgi:hypothetical protein
VASGSPATGRGSILSQNTMSNLIILPFLALKIPGAILLSRARSKTPTTVQIKQQIWGGALCGIGLLFFGIVCIIGTKMSARPETTGTLVNLRRIDGRHTRSSQFQIMQGAAQTHILSCPYIGDSLQEGQTVFVRYLEFDHSILYLRVLDGPSAGFTLDYPLRPWLGLVLVFASPLSFWLTYTGRRKLHSSNTLQSI